MPPPSDLAPSASDLFVDVPDFAARPRAPASAFWRELAAAAGPGYLVAVGYMDPGNWATGLAGGSAYG
jgi:manganese transport protein